MGGVCVKNRKMKAAVFAAWMAGICCGSAQTHVVQESTDTNVSVTATGLVAACIACLPHDPLEMIGVISVRKQRGFIMAEYPYHLTMNWGATPQRVQCDLLDDQGAIQERLTIARSNGQANVALFITPALVRQPTPVLTTPVCGTDITWLDITLDFLWWSNMQLDGQDTVRGHDCAIVLARPPPTLPGCAGVRMWIDNKMHCLLRVEQIDAQGNTIRCMSIRTVKEFNKRWLIGELEIETIGSDFRTRLRVDNVLTP